MESWVCRLSIVGALVATVVIGGCEGCGDRVDDGGRDVVSDAGARDVDDGVDVVSDSGGADMASDGGDADVGETADLGGDGRDGSVVDAGDAHDVGVDGAASDVAPDTSHPTGLPDPCSQGQGYTLFKFHFPSGGRQSPVIDRWHASCSYSVGNPACQVQLLMSPQFNGSGDAVITTSSEKIRVRFSVAGLQFSDAWVHTQARSYSTTSPADVRVWSPLYGSRTTGPVDNDFTYNWYTTNWTGYLNPSDDPDLTAIDVYADSGEVAIHAVEVCVE